MSSRPAFYGQNNNQNYFVADGKTSSRVLQAPGGSSSISLSWNDGTTTTSSTNSNNKDDDTKTVVKHNVSNNAFANGSNMNCGNVLTDRPSSRVLNPPGGKSSITFG